MILFLIVVWEVYVELFVVGWRLVGRIVVLGGCEVYYVEGELMMCLCDVKVCD